MDVRQMQKLEPNLKQFLKALPDGPVRFHFPAPPIREALKVGP